MKESHGIDTLFMRADLPRESKVGTPLIEVVGNNRVIIENQIGVSDYSENSILVKVSEGTICVEGNDLVLRIMTEKQLPI